MRLDIDFVRSQFPGLSGDWTFFDNAGGSQTLSSVVERVRDYMLSSNVQLGATYEVSARAGKRVSSATREMATYVNAGDPSEVIMGPSTSMLIRILSMCLARTWREGDEVIVTDCDHEANIGPWVDLERFGINVRWWHIDKDSLELRLEDLERLFGERTRLVAFTHASNILGTINPVRQIAKLVHDRGAMVCVDGVAYAPHAHIDVRDWDVDFYAFSLYKVYGPHQAVLFGKKRHLLEMPGINHFFIRNEQVPYKFQPGNVNYELTYGSLGLHDYIRAFATTHGVSSERQTQAAEVFAIIADHEETLSHALLDFLMSRRNVRIIGRTTADRTRRMPTISFVVGGVDSASIPPVVDRERIAIRYGDFYARRLIDSLGLSERNGVVRVSMVHYNTLEEVERLIRVFERVL